MYANKFLLALLAMSELAPVRVLELIAPPSHGLATTSEVLATIPEDLATPAEVVRPISEVLAWVWGIGRGCLGAAREEHPDSRSLSRWASRAALSSSRGAFGQGGSIGGIGAVCPGGAREGFADRAGHSPGSS